MCMKPLADMIRPNKLEDIIGQKHLIGKNKVLTNLVKNKKLFSMILFGPPGTGKTTLAYTLINELNLEYGFLNAVINSKKDFDEMVYKAKMSENFVLIMDEIHRLNKDKQDLLLPYLENGTIILIGMTTANPYHSINPAIRSRCQLFELKLLSKEDIVCGLKKATNVLDNILISDDAINYIAEMAAGDLRYAYNLLEVAYYSSSKFKITLDSIKKISDKPNIYIDKNEDGYYDVISALQKSIRGSDVDAALHYLARLLVAEDLDIIFRRLSVIAYEDIGLANPSIGPRLNAAIQACERLGLPEARIPLGEIVVEMALSPKSNSSYMAINEAINDILKGNTGKVPNHLKTNSKDYKYPHSFKGSFVKQQYLPDELRGKKYYIPKASSKYEKSIKEIYEKIEKMKNRD
ncbi:MAG: replication-associated recombination protein A [Bacilli bacterium]|nr:replication-associated recombination protein A [Bacilli bacterium]